MKQRSIFEHPSRSIDMGGIFVYRLLKIFIHLTFNYWEEEETQAEGRCGSIVNPSTELITVFAYLK